MNKRVSIFLVLMLLAGIVFPAWLCAQVNEPVGKLKEVQGENLEFKKRDYYFPFIWWDVESEDEQKRFVWTGLSFFHYRKPGKKFDMYFPFGFRHVDEEKGATLKGALGLWWKYESPEKNVHIAGPWISFDRTSGEFKEKFRGLIPFFAAYESDRSE